MGSRRMAGKIIEVMMNKQSRSSPNDFEGFAGDVLYIIDGIEKNNIPLTRCLSVIYLTNKCMLPEFRKHLKTSNMIGKLFDPLEDASEYHMLGLYTAAAIFILSQDLDIVDISENFLNLLANLLKLRPTLENELRTPHLQIVESKAAQLWLKLGQYNNIKCHIKEEYTTYQLALDSVLNLPSQCFSPWFSHVLRENGVFGNIVDVIHDFCLYLDYGILESSDNKLFQFIQFLVNTSEDQETQHLLLMYEGGKLTNSLIKLCQICDAVILETPIFNSTSSTEIWVNLLLMVLKVLVSLTHNYGNKCVNRIFTIEREHFLNTCLHILTDVIKNVSNEMRIQLMLLDLILMTNIVEKDTENRKLLFEIKLPSDPQASFFESNGRSAVDGIMSLFYEQISKENVIDTHTYQNDTRMSSQLEDSCSDMMECLITAHIGILLGYIIMDNKEYESYICHCMLESDFKKMLTILEKVQKFMKEVTSVMDISDIIFHTTHMINYYKMLNVKKNEEFHLSLTPQLEYMETDT